MAKKSADSKVIVEGVLDSITASRVDRDAGIIYGVRLSGLVSKNKRRYTEASLKNALPKYENKPCNVNHVKEGEQVKTEDRLGIFHNPRWSDRPEPGPIADLHYLKSHPLAERVCEAAERPELARAFGMSHIAEASKTRPDKDWLMVEEMSEVKSVDLVADPATVNGLFESIEKKPMKDSAKKLIESACNFKFQRKLLEQFCKDQDNCKRITEEVDIPETDKPEEIAKAVFEAVSFGVIKDGSLSPADKAAKIDALATLQTKLLEGEQVEVKEEQVTETPAVVAIGVTKAGQLCESLKFQPTIRQLTLISEANETTAKLLAEEFCRLTLDKPEKEPAAGRRVEPVKESEQVKPAQTAEELASRIA